MCQITPDEMTAVHEAAHACIGHALGFVPLTIKMRAEGTGRGQAEFATRCPRAISEAQAIVPDILTACDVIITLAGTTAEIALDAETCARKYHAMMSTGIIANDYRVIKKLLSPERGYQAADVAVLMPVLLHVTNKVVESNWHLIQQLAEALLAQGTVERKQMVSILGRRTTRPRDLICMTAWLVAGARLSTGHFSRLP